MNDTIDELHGTIERVIYTNTANGYTVFTVQQDNKEPVTVQGVVPTVHPGQLVTVRGAWKMHPKFGRQFNATSCVSHAPKSVAGLKKYLASGLIKGIGPSYAQRLVDFFGENVLDVIDKHPESLARVPGIGVKRQEAIIAGWHEQKEIAHIMVFLQEAGVSTAFATKIYKKYGPRTIELVKENPYRLAQEVWGIGFRVSDVLAKGLGFSHEGKNRITAGILFALTTAAGNGHLYIVLDDLTKQTIELLELVHETRDADIHYAFQELLLAEKVKHLEHDGKNFVALATHFGSEKGCATRLLALLRYASAFPKFDIDRIYTQLRVAEKITLHEEQQRAILLALQSKISIITGGPGTGKTTIIKVLLQIFDEYKVTYLLAAPTGRAAKRMMQATGRTATTLHRLLEFDPSIMRFVRDEKNVLQTQCIIVDEASMIDVFLAHSLLKAISLGAHVVFLGDVDQLPSVGPGNFLRDMLESGTLPQVRLSHIFRQAQDSLIVMNAHRINNGDFPLLHMAGCKRDFLFIKEDDPARIADHLETIYRTYLPSCGLSVDDSIVLVPMNRGLAGTQTLNQNLQQLLNGGEKPTIHHGGVHFKVGDRVMQIRNNYTKLVFNGDSGTIDQIDVPERQIHVRFFERVVIYESDEFDELTLAYAISVHKSQGSEYPLVIIVFFMQHYTLLARNLLYTAITRAKQRCIVIGQTKALAIAIHTNTSNKRVTFLSSFLKELI
jgi:exodeoxyribonuclease V alpha subunit